MTRLRKEAGFPTAYRFYHANGGAPVLKISYRKYTAAEQGKILPIFSRLGGLIFALRIVPHSLPGNELVTAWLRTMAGEDHFREILGPMLKDSHSGAVLSPVHKAMKRALAGKKFFINPEQLDAISKTQANYICFLALSNDTGTWTARELAPLVELEEKYCVKALNALTEAKILKRSGRSSYKCPLAANLVEYPHRTAAVNIMIGRLLKYQEDLIATGSNAWMRRGIIRADADTLCGFFPLMSLNLSAAHTYAITEKTNKSALYAIEGKITKLRSF
ncbi:MAG: hypothetical protein PHV33_05365 [Elusimicrobiales bacterium]|nr:hypothetical protein [Elusimicrobiales bacterium]